MSTGYYLDDHPQRYRQQAPRSNWGSSVSGLVVVHVAVVPLRTPRGNVAGYITTRSDPGGYHEIVDPWGFTVMARDEMMTWHIAEARLNGPAWGISFAASPDDMRADDPDVQSMLRIGGSRIRAFFDRRGIDPAEGARWLSRDQVIGAGGRIKGLIHHGTAQPSDRYDAWVRLSNGRPHPDFDRLNQMLVDAILGPPPSPFPPSEDPMKLVILADHKTGRHYIVREGDIFKHYITSPDHIARWVFFGAENRSAQDGRAILEMLAEV